MDKRKKSEEDTLPPHVCNGVQRTLGNSRCTLYNVCSVHRGVFSTSGGTMSTLGGYHEYIGGVQYIGGIP